MTDPFTLENAIIMAAVAHAGQQDKAGEPLILHPLAVMMSIDPWLKDERIVAVLHDLLEDCPDYTAERLFRIGVPSHIIEALVALKHEPSQPYVEYIQQVKANPLARAVKIADIEHNTCMERLIRLDDATIKRLLSKYNPALEELNR